MKTPLGFSFSPAGRRMLICGLIICSLSGIHRVLSSFSMQGWFVFELAWLVAMIVLLLGFSFSLAGRRMLICGLIICSLGGIYRVLGSFSSSDFYRKDFMSGYVLAQAILHQSDPYAPLPELFQRWLPAGNPTTLLHPTPHPILVGWLCLPFAFLPYESAARGWLVFELVCLVAVIVLLFRGFGLELSWRRVLLAAVLSLGWAPVVQDLYFGQFSLVLLLMLSGAWLALRQGRDWRGGILLGGMLTLKLTGWPVVLYLLLRRRWRAVAATGLTTVFLHLLAIGLHGWALVRDYYLKIGPLVSAYYHWKDTNFSLWTFGQRMFAEFGVNFLSQPPLLAPLLARVVDVLTPLTVLAISLYLAMRMREFDMAFALLACISAIINPVAWTHYLMLTVIAIGLVGQRLQALGWPRAWVKQLLWICAPFCVTHPVWSMLALIFSPAGLSAARPVVPFAVAWLTVTPTLAVLALCWLLWRVDALAGQQERVTPRATTAWSQPESAELVTT